MKRRLYLLVMVALTTIPAFSADDNNIVAEDLTVLAGDKEVLLTVSMNNTVEISDLQFDMSLPAGVTIALDEDDFEMIEINTSRTTARRHSVDFLAQPNGDIRIMCSSSRGDIFSGTTGAVVNVYLNIAEDIQNGDYEITLNNIVVSSADTTCYAEPTTSTLKVQVKRRVNFVVEGESMSEVDFLVGDSITPPSVPGKIGHSGSWADLPAIMPNEDITVNAVYVPNQYNVIFKIDGEVVQQQVLDYGTAITAPEVSEKEGYTFSGWQNVVGAVPAEDVTYEATFTVNKYSLRFVANEKVVSETSVDYGSPISPPEAPAKTGYSFVSWGNVAATMPAKDVTYTAEYKVNQYKLTYLIDGNVYKTYTLDYDSVINPEGGAEDDDYYYGWEEIPGRMPDHDVTVNAYITGIAAAGIGFSNYQYEIFTIDGMKLNNLQKGVNLVRTVDGKTKKVMVK